MNLDEYFSWAWDEYLATTPSAKKIYELLKAEGEEVINDHIALRTWNVPKVSALKLGEFFEQFGYERKGEYSFPAKKLKAWHWEKENYPKVFISELLLERLKKESAILIEELLRDVPARDFLTLFQKHTFWDKKVDVYQRLARESEYCAWMYVHGWRPNHFTVSVNHLKRFANLKELNEFLQYHHFDLNYVGGEIKGGPEVYLEQSSIMADVQAMAFGPDELPIPTCYYEFAYRYPTAEGTLYQGFVADSADKIFESTH